MTEQTMRRLTTPPYSLDFHDYRGKKHITHRKLIKLKRKWRNETRPIR